MVKDPVCGMEVDEKTARYKSAYVGEDYCFCCPVCKEKFDEKPKRFTKKKTGKNSDAIRGGRT